MVRNGKGRISIMDDSLDAKVIDMQRPKTLADILALGSPQPAAAARQAEPPPRVVDSDDGAEAPLPSLEDLSPLPQPGDPYKAFSRASAKPRETLHVILANATVRGFPYGNFDGIDLQPATAGEGPVIVVRFAGLFPVEVQITGRNLELLHVYLSTFRITWIREMQAQGDFSDKATALIRRITVKKIDH
jgi:hypothetical protein